MGRPGSSTERDVSVLRFKQQILATGTRRFCIHRTEKIDVSHIGHDGKRVTIGEEFDRVVDHDRVRRQRDSSRAARIDVEGIATAVDDEISADVQSPQQVNFARRSVSVNCQTGERRDRISWSVIEGDAPGLCSGIADRQQVD